MDRFLINSQNLPALAVALLFLTYGGCAINNVGMLAGLVTEGKGSQIIDLYVIGGHLRIGKMDSGISMGVTKRSYIFFSQGQKITPGWHYFWVKIPPADQLVALHTENIGLEARTDDIEYGITLGYRAGTILARIPDDLDVILGLHYQVADPGQTQLIMCRMGEEQCQIK